MCYWFESSLWHQVTKTTLSKMSRWKPTQERLPGLHESDEGSGCGPKGRCTELREEVGPVGVRKVLLAERAATGQKLWIGYLFPGAVQSGSILRM